jgi:hypothetical protein
MTDPQMTTGKSKPDIDPLGDPVPFLPGPYEGY